MSITFVIGITDPDLIAPMHIKESVGETNTNKSSPNTRIWPWQASALLSSVTNPSPDSAPWIPWNSVVFQLDFRLEIPTQGFGFASHLKWGIITFGRVWTGT